MTENKYTNEQLIDFMYDVMDWRDVVDQPMIYAVIEELKEIQQYRAIGTVEQLKTLQEDYWKLNEMCKEYSAIGTVEEFKALKEKSVAKKPIYKFEYEDGRKFHDCPICGSYVTHAFEQDHVRYCNCCGQKLDWE